MPYRKMSWKSSSVGNRQEESESDKVSSDIPVSLFS